MRSASIFRSGARARAGLTAVAVLSAVAAGIDLHSAQVGAPPAIFRSQTELVVLQVAVTDAHRRYVPGLRAENFTVLEQGQPQPIVVFASAAAPLDVMLLIDTSGSMAPRLADARQAALDLVGTLRSGDRAGVVLFNTIVQFAQPLTDDLGAVADAIRGAAPTGATALYEAVYLALRAVSPAPPAGGIRRRALVVLSDGFDTRSRIPFEYTLDAANASDATIFTIVPGSALFEDRTPGYRWRDGAARFELRRLAEATGGRAFVTGADSDLADVYAQIGSELREQYWVAYASPVAGPGFRRVSVRVTDPPGLVARTRTGYDAGRNRISASASPR